VTPLRAVTKPSAAAAAAAASRLAVAAVWRASGVVQRSVSRARDIADVTMTSRRRDVTMTSRLLMLATTLLVTSSAAAQDDYDYSLDDFGESTPASVTPAPVLSAVHILYNTNTVFVDHPPTLCNII